VQCEDATLLGMKKKRKRLPVNIIQAVIGCLEYAFGTGDSQYMKLFIEYSKEVTQSIPMTFFLVTASDFYMTFSTAVLLYHLPL